MKKMFTLLFFIKIRQRDKTSTLSPNKQYKHLMSAIFLKSYWTICDAQTDTEDVICWQPSHLLQIGYETRRNQWCLATSTQNLLWKVFTCYAFYFTKNSSWTSFCVPQKKENHKGLEKHEGQYMMTEFHYCVNSPLCIITMLINC